MIGLAVRPLYWLGRHATKCLALGVLSGLFLPTLAEWLRPTLPAIIVFSLTLSLLRIRYDSLFAHLRQPILLLWLVVVVLGLSPVLALLATGALPQGLSQAVVLMAAAPPIVSAAAFALILGLDAAFAVLLIVLAHLLVPITLPLLALHLLQLDLDVPALTLFGRLTFVIGISFAIAWVSRRFFFSQKVLDDHAELLDGLIVLGLVLFALAIMAGVTDAFVDRPAYVTLTLAVSFAANIALQIAGALLCWWAGRRLAFTAGLLAGNCNMGLVLAVLGTNADRDVALYFALAQFPMYMLPLFALPVYRYLLANTVHDT